MKNVYEVWTFSWDYPGIKHTLIREMLFCSKVTWHSTICVSNYQANMITCGDTKPGCMAENPSISISISTAHTGSHFTSGAALTCHLRL